MFSITPSDTNKLANTLIGLYAGASGDVAVVTDTGATITLVGLAAGVFHPCPGVVQVKTTGTTATGLVGVYAR